MDDRDNEEQSNLEDSESSNPVEDGEYVLEDESDVDHADTDDQPKDLVKRLRDNLKECTAQKQEYLDGWQRAKADMVNTKKDFTQERERLRTRVIEEVIADILPVLDSFDMAFADSEVWNKVDTDWRSGVENIYNQLKSILKSHRVEAVVPAVGDRFDPQLHTSVDTEPADDEKMVDTVAACEKAGYRLGDRVIRSANVVVFREE
ncbi:MAG: nucleotide exchange factor GrpE [Candidatus Paceibacterota bacterium]